MTAAQRALFLDTGVGPHPRRFCVHHRAAETTPRGLVVHVHAFAEEMNKSRRMAALQARALAEAGFDVLRIDLLGCGDSDGDFGDADWARWVDDVVFACEWQQRERASDGAPLPQWLWGHRVGCLIAVEAARRLTRCDGFIFWSPVPAGKSALQQFLRLKTAGDMLSGADRAKADEPRQRLSAGQTVEIAGYRLAPGLAAGLEAATLAPPRAPVGVAWFEVAADATGELSPAGQQAVARWRASGCEVRARVVTGPAFWQTSEIEDAPELIDATVIALEAMSRSAGIAAGRESAVA